jgi:hypothetical protein
MLSCSCAVVRDEARHFGSSEKSEPCFKTTKHIILTKHEKKEGK